MNDNRKRAMLWLSYHEINILLGLLGDEAANNVTYTSPAYEAIRKRVTEELRAGIGSFLESK